MKKFINYYLPVAAYLSLFIFIFLSLILTKRTPETENVVIDYQKTIFYYTSQYVTVFLLGLAYGIYFFFHLLKKVNYYFLSRYVHKYEAWMSNARLRDKFRQTTKVAQYICFVIFVAILIWSFFL